MVSRDSTEMLGSRMATFRESAERTRGDQEKSVRIGDFESPFQRLSTRVHPKRLCEQLSWDQEYTKSSRTKSQTLFEG